MSNTQQQKKADSILFVIGFPDSASPESASKALSRYAKTFTSVFAISARYQSVIAASSLSLPDNVTLIPDDASRVFAHRLHIKAPPMRITSAFSGRVAFARDSDSQINYFCVNPEKECVASVFELASLVRTETFVNRGWAIIKEGTFPFRPPSTFTVLPDFFNGDSRSVETREALSPLEKLSLKSFILQGIDTLRCFLRAGFQDLENRAPVPGWAAMTGTAWNTLILSMFQIIPGAHDGNHREEFFESASLRKILTEASLGVLANYFFCTFPPDTFISPSRLATYLSPSGTSLDLTNDAAAWSNVDLWTDIRREYIATETLF